MGLFLDLDNFIAQQGGNKFTGHQQCRVRSEDELRSCAVVDGRLHRDVSDLEVAEISPRDQLKRLV